MITVNALHTEADGLLETVKLEGKGVSEFDFTVDTPPEYREDVVRIELQLVVTVTGTHEDTDALEEVRESSCEFDLTEVVEVFLDNTKTDDETFDVKVGVCLEERLDDFQESLLLRDVDFDVKSEGFVEEVRDEIELVDKRFEIDFADEIDVNDRDFLLVVEEVVNFLDIDDALADFLLKIKTRGRNSRSRPGC